jgi:hypothetical protein
MQDGGRRTMRLRQVHGVRRAGRFLHQDPATQHNNNNIPGQKGTDVLFKIRLFLCNSQHTHKMRRKEKRTDIKSGRPPATPPAVKNSPKK